jgi:hypothetical protein
LHHSILYDSNLSLKQFIKINLKLIIHTHHVQLSGALAVKFDCCNAIPVLQNGAAEKTKKEF